MRLVPRGFAFLFCLPAGILFTLFFLLPLGSVVAESFGDSGRAYYRFFIDPVFWRGLQGTMILGTAAPLLSVLVGLFVALHLARKTSARRMALLFLISLPLTFSGLIVAYGFILVFGRAGFVTLLAAQLGANPATLAGFVFSPWGLGMAYSYYLIPRAVLILLPAILNFRFDEIAAARSLGASAFRAHVDIMIPQIMPSLFAAFCLTSAVAIGAYGTALALVGTQVNILPLLLYSKISESGSDFPAAAAMSVILMAICCLVVTAAEVLVRRMRANGDATGRGA
jgi:putative spermidine/putrescine transport system permease protein